MFFSHFQQHNWNTQAKKGRTEAKNYRPCGKHKEKCETRGRCKIVEIQTEENCDCCSNVFCGIYHIQILDHLKNINLLFMLHSSVFLIDCTSSTDHGHINSSEPDSNNSWMINPFPKKRTKLTIHWRFLLMWSHMYIYFLDINASQFRFNFFNY